MTFGKQAAQRMLEIISEGKWVAGTNYQEQLHDLSLQQATKKIDNLNTIAQLTYHVGYYLDGLNRFFASGSLDIKDKYSFDLPPLNKEVDWQQLRDNFFVHAETFAAAIENMTESQVQAVFVNEKYGDYRRNINAMIEHCYYHLGQIVLIKKMISNQT